MIPQKWTDKHTDGWTHGKKNISTYRKNQPRRTILWKYYFDTLGIQEEIREAFKKNSLNLEAWSIFSSGFGIDIQYYTQKILHNFELKTPFSYIALCFNFFWCLFFKCLLCILMFFFCLLKKCWWIISITFLISQNIVLESQKMHNQNIK